MDVDEFVEQRVAPEHREVVERLRGLIRGAAPEIQEAISYGIPAYRRRNIIAVINPTNTDITLSFSRGAEFEDKYGLLRGVGKVSKHLKLKKAPDFNEDALRYYLEQALKLDEAGPRAARRRD